MLAESTRARLAADARAFAAARPFRHAVIDGFLDAQHCAGLLDEFPRFDPHFALNEMGEVGGKAVRSRVEALGPTYAALDQAIQSPDFLSYVSALTGIPDLLYDPDYEGGGTHENRDGQGLDVHIDFNYHPRTGWHRRLNLIVYLNPEWDAAWGGMLTLEADPWSGVGEVQQIAPLFNRCVVFETNEVSWHGFAQIELPAERKQLSRKSFAIYLYTRDRPTAETAPPHATVYVPAGMPASIQPGCVLDDAACLELRVRFARLRGQLKFLYQRETEFATQIESLKHALNDAKQAQRVDLQGYARVQMVDGIWADGWVSQQLSVAFTPSRGVRALTVEVWVPPQMPTAQILRLACAGARTEASVAPGARSQLRLVVGVSKGIDARLEIEAGVQWQPAASGTGGDERQLAWRLLGITLDHV